jgi:hypothetical protein
MLKLVTAFIATTMLVAPAAAKTSHRRHSHHHVSENVRHHYRRYHHRFARGELREDQNTTSWAWSGRHLGDPRPREWCGWEMRRELGVADRSYNLARNWAHYGVAAGGPQDGAIVVWSHHVGRIVGQCSGGWIVHSGNDGGGVRDRCRSVRGAIAFRFGGSFSTARYQQPRPPRTRPPRREYADRRLRVHDQPMAGAADVQLMPRYGDDGALVASDVRSFKVSQQVYRDQRTFR